jgi:Helix-turn-helix domain
LLEAEYQVGIVNANRAVVTDQIVSEKGKKTIGTKLLTARADKPMEIIEPTGNCTGGGGRVENEMSDNPMQRAGARSKDERLLTPNETADFLRVSHSWLAKARMRGDGPPFLKVGRSIRYSRAEAAIT